MQPPRLFNFTGLSSSLIQSLLILLLFAGSLSTVPVVAPAKEPVTDNATPFPLVFPSEKARPFESATSDEKEKLNRSMRSDAELIDMRNSSVSTASATVDSDDDDASAKSPSETDFSGTVTESSAPALTRMSSVPSIVTNSTASVNVSSIVGATVESSFAAPSTALISETTTMATMTEAATTVMTTPITVPQTDSTENATATALTEDSGRMPTGVVALVTMITFVIIAVVAYVSLIVWRRYLEYRYGNRELLVNDLEFDTNDLRHFEL